MLTNFLFIEEYSAVYRIYDITLQNAVAAWRRDGMPGIRCLLANGTGLIENKLEDAVADRECKTNRDVPYLL